MARFRDVIGTLVTVDTGATTAANDGADNANTAAARANTASDTAEAKITELEAKEVSLQAKVDLAEDWAEEAEDVEVTAGAFSSKHHALKSSASASAAAASEAGAAASEVNAASSESLSANYASTLAIANGVDGTVETTGDLPAASGTGLVYYVRSEATYYNDQTGAWVAEANSALATQDANGFVAQPAKKLGEEVDIREYGDIDTDATAAILAGIAAGTNLMFPGNRTYTVNSSLTPANNTQWRMEPGAVLSMEGDDHLIDLTSVEDWYANFLHLEHQGTTRTYNCIFASGASRVHIGTVIVTRTDAWCINMRGTCEDVQIGTAMLLVQRGQVGNDGIDISSGRNVNIGEVLYQGDDDGVCIKALDGETRNVTIGSIVANSPTGSAFAIGNEYAFNIHNINVGEVSGYNCLYSVFLKHQNETNPTNQVGFLDTVNISSVTHYDDSGVTHTGVFINVLAARIGQLTNINIGQINYRGPARFDAVAVRGAKYVNIGMLNIEFTTVADPAFATANRYGILIYEGSEHVRVYGGIIRGAESVPITILSGASNSPETLRNLVCDVTVVDCSAAAFGVLIGEGANQNTVRDCDFRFSGIADVVQFSGTSTDVNNDVFVRGYRDSWRFFEDGSAELILQQNTGTYAVPVWDNVRSLTGDWDLNNHKLERASQVGFLDRGAFLAEITGRLLLYSTKISTDPQTLAVTFANGEQAHLMRDDKKVVAEGGLCVGNSAAATTPGTVTKKIEVFDASGTSLGFVAVYDAIT